MINISNSISNSNSKSNNTQLSISFKEDFDNKFYISKIGFKKDLESNNYFNATIQCLINIKVLCDEIVVVSYEKIKNNLLKNLHDLIIALTNNNIEEVNENLTKLNVSLLNMNPVFRNKDSHDSKILLKYILEECDKENLIKDNIKIEFSKNCSCEEIKTNIIEFDIKNIIKFNNNRILTIDDCFNYYLKCQKCKKKVNITKLPPVLIIFINYGDKNAEIENSYKFDEIINLKTLNEEYKEYFLSSIIACKNIGTYFELFYTFSRLDEHSNYTMYNGSEVRYDIKVKNKLEKQKIDLKDRKQSWPWVLIYCEKN